MKGIRSQRWRSALCLGPGSARTWYKVRSNSGPVLEGSRTGTCGRTLWICVHSMVFYHLQEDLGDRAGGQSLRIPRRELGVRKPSTLSFSKGLQASTSALPPPWDALL